MDELFNQIQKLIDFLCLTDVVEDNSIISTLIGQCNHCCCDNISCRAITILYVHLLECVHVVAEYIVLDSIPAKHLVYLIHYINRRLDVDIVYIIKVLFD